jgi:hypothetical protein
MKKTLLLVLLLTLNFEVFADTGMLFENIPRLNGPPASREDCKSKSDYAYPFSAIIIVESPYMK